MSDIHDHKFELFTLVSEICDNVNLVQDIKYILELEGIYNSRESDFNFLNRSITFFQRIRFY